jgi:hypothetical protein
VTRCSTLHVPHCGTSILMRAGKRLASVARA